MIDSEYDDNGLPRKLRVFAGAFMDRFCTSLLMAQGRLIAEKARRVSTFRDDSGDLRRSIVPMPLKRNQGIKVTSRDKNGWFIPYASPLGVGIDITPNEGQRHIVSEGRQGWFRFERISWGPKLNIKGPFMEFFGGNGKGFDAIEDRMRERINEAIGD